MIPDEDRGPAWLRDYGSGGFEANIERLEEFASKLEAEVMENYIPHMRRLQQEMTAQLPQPGFDELAAFVATHHGIQTDTSAHVQTLGNASGRFAIAAREVSTNYSSSDAFAAARVNVVSNVLDDTGLAAPPKPGTENTEPAPTTTDNPGAS